MSKYKIGDLVERDGVQFMVLRIKRVVHPIAGPQKERILLVQEIGGNRCKWVDGDVVTKINAQAEKEADGEGE